MVAGGSVVAHDFVKAKAFHTPHISWHAPTRSRGGFRPTLFSLFCIMLVKSNCIAFKFSLAFSTKVFVCRGDVIPDRPTRLCYSLVTFSFIVYLVLVMCSYIVSLVSSSFRERCGLPVVVLKSRLVLGLCLSYTSPSPNLHVRTPR